MIKEDKEERNSLERGKKKHQRSKKKRHNIMARVRENKEKIWKNKKEGKTNEEEAGKKAPLVLSQRGESSIRFCGKCTYI